MRRQTEAGGMPGHQELEEAGGTLPWSLGRGVARLTPLPWTSGLRAGRINVCSRAAFSLWSPAATAQVTDALGRPAHVGLLHQCHGVERPSVLAPK